MRLVCILSENHTLVPPRDLRGLVEMAVEAERAGFDAVMVSEHVVLGAGPDGEGRPANPRDYALPGNQDPATPWPSSLLLLAAVAAVTDRIRLDRRRGDPTAAPPPADREGARDARSALRGPPGRPADGELAPRRVRGARGAVRDRAVSASTSTSPPGTRSGERRPASFRGRHYAFEDVWLEPKPFRPEGPRLWFGGRRLHDAMLRRLVRYGHGFNPLGRADRGRSRTPPATRWPPPGATWRARAGRRHPRRFPDTGGVARPRRGACIDPRADRSAASRTICVKPSQFTDDSRRDPGPAHADRRARRRADRPLALTPRGGGGVRLHAAHQRPQHRREPFLLRPDRGPPRAAAPPR